MFLFSQIRAFWNKQEPNLCITEHYLKESFLYKLKLRPHSDGIWRHVWQLQSWNLLLLIFTPSLPFSAFVNLTIYTVQASGQIFYYTIIAVDRAQNRSENMSPKKTTTQISKEIFHFSESDKRENNIF